MRVNAAVAAVAIQADSGGGADPIGVDEDTGTIGNLSITRFADPLAERVQTGGVATSGERPRAVLARTLSRAHTRRCVRLVRRDPVRRRAKAAIEIALPCCRTHREDQLCRISIQRPARGRRAGVGLPVTGGGAYSAAAESRDGVGVRRAVARAVAARGRDTLGDGCLVGPMAIARWSGLRADLLVLIAQDGACGGRGGTHCHRNGCRRVIVGGAGRA